MAQALVYDAIIPAPFGRLGIRIEKDRLIDVDLLSGAAPLQTPREKLAREVCQALKAYLANPKQRLRLPIALAGTEHQVKVWRALQQIPAGKVKSYGELARHLGSSPRAIGAACRSNPIAIVVPCHRVVSSTGELGGFMGKRSGAALDIKRWLLEHEQRR